MFEYVAKNCARINDGAVPPTKLELHLTVSNSMLGRPYDWQRKLFIVLAHLALLLAEPLGNFAELVGRFDAHSIRKHAPKCPNGNILRNYQLASGVLLSGVWCLRVLTATK